MEAVICGCTTAICMQGDPPAPFDGDALPELFLWPPGAKQLVPQHAQNSHACSIELTGAAEPALWYWQLWSTLATGNAVGQRLAGPVQAQRLAVCTPLLSPALAASNAGRTEASHVFW